jgi:hypothetical protein
MTNFALISDVHSQSHLLNQALDYSESHNLNVIFLGDLFDSRIESSDSVGVYHLVKNAIEEKNAICIQSNHQNKLIRFLNGNNVYVGDDLQRTLNDFKDSDVSLKELYDFLIDMPYGIAFKDKDGTEYRAAHAYFSSKIDVPEYTDYALIYENSLNRSIKSTMLYGPLDKESRIRVEWWKNNSNKDYVMVSGHYHTIHIDEHSIVIDPECGSENGGLGLYDVNKKILKKFY